MSKYFKFLVVFLAFFALSIRISPNVALADDRGGVFHTHSGDEEARLTAQRLIRKEQRKIQKREEREAQRKARMDGYFGRTETGPKRATRDLTIGSTSSRNSKPAPKEREKRYIYNKSQNRTPSNIGGRAWGK